MIDDRGLAALTALDEALRQKPHADQDAFSAAARGVAAFRDHISAEAPSPTRRKRLDHVNAVMSMVLAGHFPLGPIQWDEIAAARGWLAELVHGGTAA